MGDTWSPHTDRSCVQSLSATFSVDVFFTHVHLPAVEQHTHTLGRGEISVSSAPHFVPTLRVGWSLRDCGLPVSRTHASLWIDKVPTLRVGWSLRDCSLPVSRTHASLWIERSRHWLLETTGNAQSLDICRSRISVYIA